MGCSYIATDFNSRISKTRKTICTPNRRIEYHAPKHSIKYIVSS